MAGPAQPAFVQANTVNWAASTTSMSPALSGVGVGNALILVVSSTYTAANVVTSVSDSAGQTWARATSAAYASGACVDIWYCLNATAGTHTLTVSCTSATTGCELQEFSGVNAFYVTDGVNALKSNAGSTALLFPDLSSLCYLNDLVVVGTSSSTAQTSSAVSGWTYRTGPTNSGTQRAGIAYQSTNVVGTLTSATTGWTMASAYYASAAIVLRGASPAEDAIWNDPAATVNPAVLSAQARPDYLDSIDSSNGASGYGVLATIGATLFTAGSALLVHPYNNSSLTYNVEAGFVLVGWAPKAVGALTNQTITAADGTNPRRDIVYVTGAGVIAYQAGVAAATPLPPNLPLGCILLAVIEVPANATTLDNGTSTSNAHVTDKRIPLNLPFSARDVFQGLTSGMIAETIPYYTQQASQSLTTSVTNATGFYLPAGVKVANLKGTSVGAISSPTHWWFGLADSAYTLLAATADKTTTAWAASTTKSLPIATSADSAGTSFTTKYSGLYYLLHNITATSPTLQGISVTGAYQALAVQLDTLTTPPAIGYVFTYGGGNTCALYGQVS